MPPQEQAEEAIVRTTIEMETDGSNKEEERGGHEEAHGTLSMKSFLWHGGSVWDAWFSCASNQVAISPPPPLFCFVFMMQTS
jgi:auxin influx carrier (AUX1 LAX family)